MALKPKTTAAFKSNKLGQLITPIGSALFVSCPNASTYDAEKQEASVVLTAEDFTVFKAQVDKLIANYTEELVIDPADMEMPIKDATDKDGNPTGEIIVKAKTRMIYPAKLYTAKGTQFNPEPGFKVPNRSKIRLSVSAELVNTKMYKGLVLRLNAVQIVSSTPWAGTDPFDAVDGDFEYTPDASFEPTDDEEDLWK